jgi:hypothetical protein
LDFWEDALMRHAPSAGLAAGFSWLAIVAAIGCSDSNGGDGGNGTGGTGAGSGASGGSGGTSGKGSGGSTSGGRGGSKSGAGGSESGSSGDDGGAEGGTESGSGGTGAEAGAGGSSGTGTTPAFMPGLWYGGTSLCAFAEDRLQASSDIAPEVLVPLPPLTAVLDVALDESGYIWVVGTGSDSIFRYPAASLEDPESPAPDLEITSSALQNPGNLTLDAAGGLWVATRPPIENGRVEEGMIFRFDVPDDASGTMELSPAAELSSATEGDLDLIGNITFDADGNLWVSSLVGLLRFDAATELSDAVEVEPGALIDKTGYPNNIHFYSVAFDSHGDLWTASGDGFHFLASVTKFEAPGELEGRGSPDAAVSILGEMDLLPAGGIAFDEAGDLWLATGNALFKYSDPDALNGEVAPSADIAITLQGEAIPSTSAHLLFVPSR